MRLNLQKIKKKISLHAQNACDEASIYYLTLNKYAEFLHQKRKIKNYIYTYVLD